VPGNGSKVRRTFLYENISKGKLVWFKTKRLTDINDFYISTNVTSVGIGKGIAKRLAQEGANVLVHFNTRKDLEIAFSIVNKYARSVDSLT